MGATCFMMLPIVAFFKNEILKSTGLSNSSFYRKAVEYFLDNNKGIPEQTLVNASERTYKDQAYIDKEQLDKIAEYIKISKNEFAYKEEEKRKQGQRKKISMYNRTTVLNQAAIEYAYFIGKRILISEDNEVIEACINYILKEKLLWVES